MQLQEVAASENHLIVTNGVHDVRASVEEEEEETRRCGKRIDFLFILMIRSQRRERTVSVAEGRSFVSCVLCPLLSSTNTLVPCCMQ
jgi:hypothetical protein